LHLARLHTQKYPVSPPLEFSTPPNEQTKINYANFRAKKAEAYGEKECEGGG